MLELLWLVPAIPFASALVLAVVRLPRKVVAWLAVASIAASTIISLVITYSFLHAPPAGNAYTQVLWRWLDVSGFILILLFTSIRSRSSSWWWWRSSAFSSTFTQPNL